MARSVPSGDQLAPRETPISRLRSSLPVFASYTFAAPPRPPVSMRSPDGDHQVSGSTPATPAKARSSSPVTASHGVAGQVLPRRTLVPDISGMSLTALAGRFQSVGTFGTPPSLTPSSGASWRAQPGLQVSKRRLAPVLQIRPSLIVSHPD